MNIKTNLHSHTQFCDARDSMEKILEAAHSARFKIWGFSPHSPICIDSPCNMAENDVPAYLNEIKRLKSLFRDIKILAGMEVDYIDDENGPSSPSISKYNLDYIIGSVHFIPNQKNVFIDIDGSPDRFRKYLNEYFESDLEFVVKSYWNQVQKMIRRGGFDIIGHIDKIALNASFIDSEIENNPLYVKLAEDTVEMAIKTRKAIEINTKHFGKYGRFFPHPRYWKHIISNGIDMPINSDTHYAEKVEDGMAEALYIKKNL